jgi:hypothetical protein
LGSRKDIMNPAELKLTGDADYTPDSSLLEFWRWAFSDQCDDDIKGVFAEWMVGILLGLPLASSRRISWANSDIILPSGLRIEVKSCALWQSWKLLDESGRPKPPSPQATLDPNRIRFGGLQARTAVSPGTAVDVVSFKSDVYVFCMHVQTDPIAWDAWNLSNWEFYVMTKEELSARNIATGITLATLRGVRPAMSARAFQSHMKQVIAEKTDAQQ